MSRSPRRRLAPDLRFHYAETLGRNLKSLRAARGWRLEDVAHTINVSLGKMSEIERGLAEPSLRELLALQHLYGVASLESLLGQLPSQQAVSEAGSQGVA